MVGKRVDTPVSACADSTALSVLQIWASSRWFQSLKSPGDDQRRIGRHHGAHTPTSARLPRLAAREQAEMHADQVRLHAVDVRHRVQQAALLEAVIGDIEIFSDIRIGCRDRIALP